MKKNKRLIGYANLKEACAAARQEALDSRYHYIVSVYEESDGSFTVGDAHTNKAQFKVAIDKSGARYIKKWVRDNGYKHETFVRIK